MGPQPKTSNNSNNSNKMATVVVALVRANKSHTHTHMPMLCNCTQYTHGIIANCWKFYRAMFSTLNFRSFTLVLSNGVAHKERNTHRMVYRNADNKDVSANSSNKKKERKLN